MTSIDRIADFFGQFISIGETANKKELTTLEYHAKKCYEGNIRAKLYMAICTQGFGGLYNADDQEILVIIIHFIKAGDWFKAIEMKSVDKDTLLGRQGNMYIIPLDVESEKNFKQSCQSYVKPEEGEILNREWRVEDKNGDVILDAPDKVGKQWLKENYPLVEKQIFDMFLGSHAAIKALTRKEERYLVQRNYH